MSHRQSQIIRATIFTIFVALSWLSGPSHAMGALVPPSSNTGKIMVLPPQSDPEWADVGRTYKPGTWLALACEERVCRLVSVKLNVRTNHRRKDESPEFFVPQTMSWDLSALHSGENVLMFVEPGASLRAGPVQTWQVTTGRVGAVAVADRPTRIATPTASEPNRISILVPRNLNPGCTKAKEEIGQCERTLRMELKEGNVTQWLGEPWADACGPIGYGPYWDTANYVRWVGDLDHDERPDYLTFHIYSGLTLFLSSLAQRGELAGEAGHYHPGILCD